MVLRRVFPFLLLWSLFLPLRGLAAFSLFQMSAVTMRMMRNRAIRGLRNGHLPSQASVLLPAYLLPLGEGWLLYVTNKILQDFFWYWWWGYDEPNHCTVRGNLTCPLASFPWPLQSGTFRWLPSTKNWSNSSNLAVFCSPLLKSLIRREWN